jgi:CheY-like chemotaxis protein
MYSILLLEDDPDDQLLFKEALQIVNPDILLVIASDGEEGLTIIDNLIQKPDLIFSDINMPKLDGIEFTKVLRNTKGITDIPVVIISTSDDPKHREEITSLGAIFFPKPAEFKGISTIIRQAMRLVAKEGY